MPDPTPPLSLSIDPEIAPRIKADSFLVGPVNTGPRPSSLDEELGQLEERYRSLWAKPVEAQEALRPARRLYHAFGIDPSKTRPSSEALLRRVLQRKPLYRVNAPVDAANLASLTLLLPVGLYDAEKIAPPVHLRVGRDRESYAGIRKDEIHLAGRPTLADRVGPFGNPTSDSLRTSVSEETKTVWFVLFAPADYPEATFHEDLRRAEEILSRHAIARSGGGDAALGSS